MSTAEALATQSGEMTLFIPPAVQGFVSCSDGVIRLGRILVAVTREPRPEPTIEAARRLMLVTASEGVASLLFVGNPAERPALDLPEIPGWMWETLCKKGDVVETILRTVGEIHAGLIVMATARRHGFLDALRGTVAQHILREAGCPLLAMPEGSFLG